MRPPSSVGFASIGTGRAGGVTFETTGRLTAGLGGVVVAVPACAPRTLRVDGITSGLWTTAAVRNCAAGTSIACRSTGSALANVRSGTTVVAPGTVWFAYL